MPHKHTKQPHEHAVDAFHGQVKHLIGGTEPTTGKKIEKKYVGK